VFGREAGAGADALYDLTARTAEVEQRSGH